MSHVIALGFAATLALAASAASQNITVFPSDHTGTGPNLTLPGETYVYYNPLSNGVARQMLFFDAWDVRISNGRRISRIGFPRDPDITSIGYAVQLKVQMGQSTLGLSGVSSVFAQNFSTPPSTVFANAQGNAKVFSLPDLGGVGGVDVVWLPLDTPFVFDSTRSLVIDFQVFANQNGNNPFYYYLDAAGHRSSQRSYGQACATSGGVLPSLTSASLNSYIGGQWQLDLSNAPATAALALLVGVAPYEPGIRLDGLGMTNCTLSVDGLWSGASVTQPGGWFNWSFTVPNNRALFGGRLYSQAVMQDVFANPMGWITSNGDELQLGIRPQATLVYGNQGQAQATSGFVVPDYGQITLFDHD